MRGLIMANGEYGGLNWYAKRKDKYPYILCTDGAAKMARRLDILPDAVVGDMDSISQGDLLYMEDREVSFFRHPPEKDFTDTHLALELLREKGFSDITIWGGTGGRLDHTISNILSTITFVQIGISIIFEEPGLTIYIIEDKIKLTGRSGEVVSIFPLGGRAGGINLRGFKYPLSDATLEQALPIGVSNELSENEGYISLGSGVIAVFHYKKKV